MTGRRPISRLRWTMWICCCSLLLLLQTTFLAAHDEWVTGPGGEDGGRDRMLIQGGSLPGKSVVGVTARPRCLAAADLDRNGIPDVVTGLATTDGGLITIHFGDADAYPARVEAPPFLPTSSHLPVPFAPDWIVAGDFDADGRQDLVVAARDNDQLVLLRGSGEGFEPTVELVDLPGGVSALAAGDVNRRDGLEDLVVAVHGGREATLLVFESPLGALRGEPEAVALTAPANGVDVGKLVSGSFVDIVVATPGEVLVVEGRDRRLSRPKRERDRVPTAVVHNIDLHAQVEGIAVGRFTGMMDQLAALTSDGDLLVLGSEDGEWRRERVAQAAPPDAFLATARVSGGSADDLLLGAAVRGLEVIHLERSGTGGEPLATVTAVEGGDTSIAAVLPLRLNLDAFDDLVVLVEGRSEVDVFFTDRGTTFTVNTTDDLDDEYCTTLHCSLREAIDAADALAGTDTIEFAIGFNPILLTESLPNIHYPVVIDGLQGTCPMSCFPTQIDGSGAGADAIAFDVNGGGVTLSHLIVHDLDGIAVDLAGHGNVVENCQIGVDRAGNAAANGVGLVLRGSSGNTIGGSTSQGNVLSGNEGPGIHITGGSASNSNVVTGNFIGTNSSGSAGVGNGEAGVLIDTLATGNTIGSTAAPNIVSGNGGPGIQIGHPDSTGAMFNLVVANLIGVDDDGTTQLGNGDSGVLIDDYSDDNTIGGTTADLGNVISGNLGHGVEVRANADRTQIQGNIIGLAIDGHTSRPNLGVGVVLDSADSSLVGGIVAAAGNFISRNTGWGMVITGSGSDAPTATTVLRNYIGTDSAGSACRGNGAGGLRMSGRDSTIGDDNPSNRNVIGCNGGDGIRVSAASGFATTGNTIAGNRIGRVSTGYGELANTGNGITISGAVTNTEIGLDGSHNIIAHNGGAGVVLSGSSPSTSPQGISIRFNEITDNGGLGIDLAGTTGGDGVTPNDDPAALDTDTGPNGYQNYPVIQDVNADTYTITVRLDSAANTTYTIDVYSTAAEYDPSAFGEGAFHYGSFDLTTGGDGSGFGAGQFMYQGMVGLALTVTATDVNGNTSEFSECFVEGEGLVTEHIFSDGFENSILSWSDVVGWANR